MAHTRYAIYFVPNDGDLAAFGARWLGWDIARGVGASQFDLAGLEDITQAPRKYGLHGTLKPPFRLAEGRTRAELETAVDALARIVAPAECDGLALTALGRFLALTPQGPTDGLRAVADGCVRALDPFRAPATEAELARRRKAGLSAQQEVLLREWGYPYVLEEFRFHLTLSGRLPPEKLPTWQQEVRARLPALPRPFVIDQIALCGERADGQFELLHRFALSGGGAAPG